MSRTAIRAYTFRTPEQWSQCSVTGFSVQSDGSLLQGERLGSYAVHVPDAPGETGIPLTVDAYGQIFRLKSGSEPMAQSPRLIVDREWAWWFEAGGSVVRRSDVETLQLDLEVDAGRPVLDIASDGREGIWILCGGECPMLIHFDCLGRLRQRYAAPFEAASARQLVSAGRGATLALLTQKGSRLVLVDAASGRVLDAQDLGPLADGWTVNQFVSDARDRIAIWGVQPASLSPAGLLLLLDSRGNIVDGPLTGLFDQPDGAQPPYRLHTIRIAVDRQVVWLFTDTGIWRAAPADGAGARPSQSSLTTPVMYSPVVGGRRGWLRAEASVKLSQGAALEALVFTTDDQKLADAAAAVAKDTSVPPSQIQDRIWALFDASQVRTISIPGPTDAAVPIAIPILESTNRWAVLRLSLITPPGNTTAPLSKLRVLYPNVTIAESLPSVFRGAKYDASGTLRNLVGVLESTTQQFDELIRGAASYLNPLSAPEQWLNYLARWFDLPWDDALPVQSKRRLLAAVPALLQWRGTRKGLQALLQSLVGPNAKIDLVDLTVDRAPVRLGGCGGCGASLPAILPGAPLRAPVLGSKAVVGRACLGSNADPLSTIAPTLRIRIAASRDAQAGLEDLMLRVLGQFVPAGLNIVVRWRDASMIVSDVIGEDGIVLDDPHIGTLGRDTTTGQSRIGGRDRGRLGDIGFGMGRLQ
jgi:phage tail-like protein